MMGWNWIGLVISGWYVDDIIWMVCGWYHLDITHIASKYHPYIIHMICGWYHPDIPAYHPYITHISSTYYPYITHISSRYHPYITHIIQILPTSLPNITQTIFLTTPQLDDKLSFNWDMARLLQKKLHFEIRISIVIGCSLTQNYVQLRKIIFISCNFAAFHVPGETSISKNYGVISTTLFREIL